MKKVKIANVYTPDTKHIYSFSMEESILSLISEAGVDEKKKRIKRFLKIHQEVHDEISHLVP